MSKKTSEEISTQIKEKRGTTLDHFADMVRWQTVWLRIVAKAWDNEKFRDELLDHNISNHNLISRYFGYELNPNLKLSIKASPDERGGSIIRDDESTYVKNANIPVSELVMYLPPDPKGDRLKGLGVDRAVALADYSEAGRTYPFTCW